MFNLENAQDVQLPLELYAIFCFQYCVTEISGTKITIFNTMIPWLFVDLHYLDLEQ